MKKEADKKFLLIQYTNPDNGFCAMVTSVLNCIRIAEEMNVLPVVYLGGDHGSYFFDPAVGDNIWEYYFEAIGDTFLIKELVGREIRDERALSIRNKKDLSFHLDPKDENYISHFWVQDIPNDPAKWMKKKRRLGRKYVDKYVSVKKHILDKVDQFKETHFDSEYIIGVHIRGTDFGYANAISPEQYFLQIDLHLTNINSSNWKIFLATDQTQFVDIFCEKYPEKIIVYDSIRSSNHLAAFQTEGEKYKKGEDVLIDILLLSNTDYLIKGASAVGEYALWFNNGLNCYDFGLNCKWDPSHYANAALKLNVTQQNIMTWKLTLVYKKVKRSFLDLIIKTARKLLPSRLRNWMWIKFGRAIYFFK